MINDLFEPPPTWWEIIKEILLPMVYYTSNNEQVGDQVGENDNRSY